MKYYQKPSIKLTPIQSLLLGFIILILIGAFLLALPVSTSKNTIYPFIDALFTATSAVTTTGLIVADTGSFYSLFGQIIILILFQIGGLGYMIFFALVVLGLSGRLSIRSKMLLSESFNHLTFENIIKFAKKIIVFTFLFEFIGAIILSLYWMRHFSIPKAIYLGIFHSVSAFCTAGFGLFSNNFISYNKSVFINLTISCICIIGAIGFFVLYDIYTLSKKTVKYKKSRQLSVHSKFVITITILLILIGTGIIFFSEYKISPENSFLSAVFQSISASTTTGFNTVNIGGMTLSSLFTLIFLMFIGASPGGTGGGIKTASFGLMLLFAFAMLTGNNNTNLFNRRIPQEIINKAFTIGFIAILWIMLSTLILTATEGESFLNIFFEVVSAFGTVGLSTGITSQLSFAGKIIISITMLIGRIGPLAIGFSLIGKPKIADFEYAKADILVG